MPTRIQKTTAVEILRDFAGDRLDYFVSGFGTGGTLLGVARKLKAERPDVRIVAAEPDNAQVLGSGIPQPRDAAGKPTSSHPHFRPHLMQGWSPDFVSTLTEDALGQKLIDEIVPVSGDDAMALSRMLAREEGIFAGTSSGATLAAAISIAQRSAPGTNIVCMLPDTGERYLSTPLFEDIGEEMNDEEMALSRSTPTCRFDQAQGCAIPPPRFGGNAIDELVETSVEDIIAREPVVLFALEWCEFCWSVRKLFRRLNIDYTSIDLDSVAYQHDDRGGKIRAVLAERIGSPTIPQVFIAGEHIGGATELFDAMRDGSMQARLEANGIAFDADPTLDPYTLLPQWLQPRKSA